MTNVAAVDLGASGGRVALVRLDNGRMELIEIHRFENTPLTRDGCLCWDIDRLFVEIKAGLKKAASEYGFESVGIDTWGVDFGVVDGQNIIVPPAHYRDARTRGVPAEVYRLISPDELYTATGNRIMEINTLFQLYALGKQQPELFARSGQLLLMPDLFGWLLTGTCVSEISAASTTQLTDSRTRDWNFGLIEKLGFPRKWFAPVVPSGTPLGAIRAEIREECGLGDIPAISVAGHDTACAALAVPAEGGDVLYISCGTWSLLGTQLEQPVLSAESAASFMTNEIGYGGKIEYLCNITGMWMLQEIRRDFREAGRNYSYDAMEDLARASRPFAFLIDPDDAAFMAPGNMPARIREWCAERGQGGPETDGALIRCVYDSVAVKYRLALERLEALCGKTFPAIHMVGGGIRSRLLCELAASVTGRRVIAGPVEATALGNAAIQCITLGRLSGVQEARNIIRESFRPECFEPAPIDAPADIMAIWERISKQ